MIAGAVLAIVSFCWVFGLALLLLGSLPLALVPESLFLHEFLHDERCRVLLVGLVLCSSWGAFSTLP